VGHWLSAIADGSVKSHFGRDPMRRKANFLIVALAALSLAASNAKWSPVQIDGDTATFVFGATDADMAKLDSHPELKSLKIGGDPIDIIGPVPPYAITDAGFAHVAHCTKLQRLMIDAEYPLNVSDGAYKALEPLGDLRVAELCSLSITDAATAHLAGLTNLQELWLDSDPNLGDGTMRTAGKLSNLRVLRCYQAAITDAGIEQIKQLTKLEDLQLGRSDVGDRAMATIATFTRLKTLDLQHTRITDAGLSRLSRLKLNWLYLDGTKITDDGLKAIENMTDMQYLFLADTPIDDAGLAHLAKFKHLQILAVGGTRVTPSGLRRLAALGVKPPVVER
jgi:hypothetical protein